MFDFSSHYALLKSVMTDKAKAEIKPSLNDKASMQAYAKAVGVTGRACFTATQSSDMVIEYV